MTTTTPRVVPMKPETEADFDDGIELDDEPIAEPQGSYPEEIIPAKRGRGRPKGPSKVFISQLPAPAKFEFPKAADFFSYIRSIPKDKRSRVILTFYRYLPICDLKQGDRKKPGNIGKIPMEVEPFPFEPEDWETALLHLYGSGNYGCYLNESNGLDSGDKTICRCLAINTRWDLENYPPNVDPTTLVEDHYNNKSYIQWLRQRGIRLPSEIDQDQVANEMQLGATIDKLTDTVIGLSQRANTPVPPAPYRESASEKLTLESASAAIDMVKKQAESITQSQNHQTDPMSIIQGYVALAQTMKGGDDALKLMLEMERKRAEVVETRLQAAEARNMQFMERLMNQNPNAQAPKTLLDQLRELREMKELMGDVLGGGGDGESRGSRDAGFKELIVQNLPAILQGGLALVDRVANAGTAMLAVSKGQPIPTPNPPQVQEPQAQQQPALVIPPGWDEGKVRGYFQALTVIGTPLINHFKRSVEDPENANGYDFAQHFIAAYGEVPAYTSILADCPKNPEGVPNIEPLMIVMKQYPPIWKEVSTVEQEFRKFITEFLTIKDLPPEDDVQEGVAAQ